MNTIDYYMSLPYKLEIIPDTDEGGYVGYYPDLPGCITTGESLKDIAINAEDAKKEWLFAALQEGLDIPEPEEKIDSDKRLAKETKLSGEIMLEKFYGRNINEIANIETEIIEWDEPVGNEDL